MNGSTNETSGVLNSTNATFSKEEVGNSSYISQLGLTLYGSTFGTFILIANGILLITLFCFNSKHLKHSTRYFLIQKTSAYTIEGLLLICWPHIPLKQCVYFILSAEASLRVTVWGMFMLSLDSFITIFRPYTHKLIMTPRFAKLLVILLFLTNVFFILLYSLFGNSKPSAVQPFCTTHDGPLGPVALLVHLLLSIVVFCTALCMQGMTLYVLWKKSQKPVNTIPSVSNSINQAPQPNPTGPKVKKTTTRLDRLVQLLVVSAICTTICWMPSTLANTTYYLGLLSINESDFEKVKKYFGVLFAVDGVLQPCIVIMMSQELRRAAKKLFCKSSVVDA